MTYLDSNSVAARSASERGTLVIRECFNERLNVAYWALEDENGVIETFLSEGEATAFARDLVASDKPLVVGERVICNGFPGVVKTVCEGQLEGLVEVKLESGVVCVPGTFPDCYRAERVRQSYE